LKFALIEIPPYGPKGDSPINPNTPCILGKLDTSKEWFVTTPAMSLIQDSNVLYSWEENVPIFEELKKYSLKSKKK